MKNETLEKIEAGTIRIEDGRLTGLGCGKESLSIEALDKLMDLADKNNFVKVMSDTISFIAELQSMAIEHENLALPITLTDFINNKLKPSLPTGANIFYLNEILKTFNA